MEVRKDERVLLLRSLDFSAWRMRFFDDANLGKGFTSLESFSEFRIQNLTIYRYLHNPFFIFLFFSASVLFYRSGL